MNTVRPFLLASLLSLASLACSESTTSAPVAGDLEGSLGIALQIPGGQTINTVAYQITGPSSFTKSGAIDASLGARVSAVISPLPVGTGYQIALTAGTTDGAATCAGNGPFDVVAGATSMLTVQLDCHFPPKTGSISVNGTFNVCPVLDGVAATPAEAFVGRALSVTAAAHDVDSGPSALSYLWSAPSGTFSSTTAVNPAFTCTAGGPVTLTVSVSDGDPTAGCSPSATVTVTCTNAAP